MKTTSILCPTCGKIIFMGPTQDEAKCLSCGHLAKAPGQLTLGRMAPNLIVRHEVPELIPEVTRPLVVQVQHTPTREASWSHSLGIGATVLGVVALLISLIPFVGMLSILLGGVGLVLAWFGLMAAFSRRGHGIGYPLTALTLNGLALLIGLFWAETWKDIREWIEKTTDRTLAAAMPFEREGEDEAPHSGPGPVVAGAKQVIEPRADGSHPAPEKEIKTVRVPNQRPEDAEDFDKPTKKRPARKVVPPVVLTDADRERIAKSRLHQAIKLEEVGNLQAASQRLAKLIDEFPSTAAASEARKRLDIVNGVLKVRELK